jgi:hypothetical protein
MISDDRQRARFVGFAARALRGGTPSISRLNDHATHADVLALIDGYLRQNAD